MSDLLERVAWVIIQHGDEHPHEVAWAIVKEIETTHCVLNPEEVTDKMLDACFTALPEHYDPPDPKRRAWHGFKAKRRFSAMARAAKKIIE